MNEMFLIAFVVAVVLWLAISLIIVVGMGQRRTDARREEFASAQQAAGLELSAEAEPPSPFMLPAAADEPWEKQLDRLPGLSGWVLIESNGEVIESSKEEFETAGASLSKLLGWISLNTEDLGVEPLQLLELDTEKGSIIVLFPRDREEEARLVLFLDQEMYQNQVRETLSRLNWEQNLKGA